MNPSLQNRLSYIEKLHGWCWYEKSYDLAQLVLVERPATVVELGVFGGRAIAAMAMAGQMLGYGKYIGIDPWSKSAAIEGEAGTAHEEWWSAIDLEKIYSDCQIGLKQLGLETIELWRMDDQQALERIQDHSIDIFHSDSNHSEVVSVRVTRQWHSKIRPGGLVIFDDHTWPTQAEATAILKGERDLPYRLVKEVITEGKGSYIVSRKVA